MRSTLRLPIIGRRGGGRGVYLSKQHFVPSPWPLLMRISLLFWIIPLLRRMRDRDTVLDLRSLVKSLIEALYRVEHSLMFTTRRLGISWLPPGCSSVYRWIPSVIFFPFNFSQAMPAGQVPGRTSSLTSYIYLGHTTRSLHLLLVSSQPSIYRWTKIPFDYHSLGKFI